MKKYSSITLMKWKYLFGALMLLPISAREFILTQWGAVPSTAWFAIAFVIFFSTFFSYFLVPFGQKYLQPTTVAMYNYLQPVTASLIAVAASQETFGPVKALAMLLVFLGVWFVSTSGQRKTGVAIFSLRKDRN
ncbi:MAG: DMT family transporter [Bacteroidales bacterium]|nr:DMT family transporter [Bacteroidales bacterium]